MLWLRQIAYFSAISREKKIPPEGKKRFCAINLSGMQKLKSLSSKIPRGKMATKNKIS